MARNAGNARSRRGLAALLGLVLLLAGCTADSGASHSDDNDKNSGFYTGMTGGGVRP